MKVQDWTRLKNATDMRNFLELLRYYSRFIQNFSKEAAQLTNLTRRIRLFIWGVCCRQVFVSLTERLTSALMLVIPNGNEESIVQTHACGT